MGYQRELEWNEPPTHCERRYARWTVVRAAGLPAASWWPLAHIGAVNLYLAPPGSEQEAPSLSVTPLIAGKRGRSARRPFWFEEAEERLLSRTFV